MKNVMALNAYRPIDLNLIENFVTLPHLSKFATFSIFFQFKKTLCQQFAKIKYTSDSFTHDKALQTSLKHITS